MRLACSTQLTNRMGARRLEKKFPTLTLAGSGTTAL